MVFRIAKIVVLAALLLSPLVISRDTLQLRQTDLVASPYLFGMLEWEAANFFSKWVHKAVTALPWASESPEERRNRFNRHFELGEEIIRLRHEINNISSQKGNGKPKEQQNLEMKLSNLVKEQRGIRNSVEEYLESELSAALREQQVTSIWGLVLPPTDVRLEETPKLLVISPRDVIERKEDLLLMSAMRIEDMEALESRILQDQNMSALVTDIGGIATYPAIIPTTQSRLGIMENAAHEWLHHYFFFKPLGQRFWSSAQMTSLNETAANVAGREMGALVCLRIVGDAEECASPRERERDDNPKDTFSFNEEMRKTRLGVEELLSEGKIGEAESYMEERRLEFVGKGFLIRKLNQAYFAFNGTYADSPASISPIGDQLEEMRSLLPNVGQFIKTISQISSYEQFLALLEDIRIKSKS